jgi:hypothetical protein
VVRPPVSPSSDTPRRTIMRPPGRAAWGLRPVPHQLPGARRGDPCLWEPTSSARDITSVDRFRSLRIRTVSNRSPDSVIRTITDRRRCRSIPTTCRPAYSSLTGASFVVGREHPESASGVTGSGGPLILHRISGGAPPGTRTPNPLIERQRSRHVPSSAPVLVRGGESAPRSWLVVARVAQCRVISGEFNGRLIMPCSAW